jgi:hypothetical protein
LTKYKLTLGGDVFIVVAQHVADRRNLLPGDFRINALLSHLSDAGSPRK